MTQSSRIMVLALVVAISLVANRPVNAEPVLLQLPSTMVAAEDANGYRGRAKITPYLSAQDPAAVPRACRGVPRLLDAIIGIFEIAPLKLSALETDLAARQRILSETVRDQVGIDVFEALFVLPGNIQMGEGTRSLNVDGETQQCHAVAALPNLEQIVASQLERLPVEVAQAPELQGERMPFPDAPPRLPVPSWPMTTFFFLAMGGFLLMIGSYIGYRIGKIRRDRRRVERRSARNTRRFVPDRRNFEGGPPDGQKERRKGKDRRKSKDDRREKSNDRRTGPRRTTG